MYRESADQRVTQNVTRPSFELSKHGRDIRSLLELEEARAFLENKCGAGELDRSAAKVFAMHA